ncbi:MAG: Ig-like domain-containing protein, partial [Akkermansiaceae bacterium]|nr:Ig-like domain-containing protein [Akkermansiaceae bacterium]
MNHHRIAMFAAALAGMCPVWGLAGEGQATLLGWNNLGMHCMDDDYSVFSILPPYNTLNAHLIDASGRLVKSGAGITVTFEGVADPDGSINRTTVGKTNFWDFVQPCYGVTLAPEFGLTGVRMPGPANVPQPLEFASGTNWFEALGIPIIPVDDMGRTQSYPVLRLTAKNATGEVLATTDVVAPVSGEMDCRACHGSNAGDAAKPAAGWANDPHPSRDYRLNILLLHDEKHLADPVFQAALATNHFRPEGLHATATAGGTPILCAKCHASEALGTPGAADTSALTRAMHHKHAHVINPANGLTLNHSANRSACYTCHPGSDTRCLRGAMGGAVAADGSAAMQCQSCHGNMEAVGAANRTGWLDEPNCQQCHTGSATLNNGQIRYTSVFEANGTPRVPVNNLFATNPDTPAAGISLYRFSKGHGGLQCSACHGSTHAEFPATHRNDNLQSAKVQGHAGVVADCTACHATMPSTVTGGPHGMHPAGQSWIAAHKDNGKSDNCKAYHGADYRGTVLSRMFADRTLTVIKTGTTLTLNLWRGQTLSCFVCHKREDDGKLGGVFTNNRAPVVPSPTLTAAPDTSTALTLTSTDADNNPRTYRIVSQPQHGSVALAGAVATYFPEYGYTGPDWFTFAANDGFTDSNLGTVSVDVGSPAVFATRDSDGDGLSDLVEYALGLSPDFPSLTTATMPTYQTVSGRRYL